MTEIERAFGDADTSFRAAGGEAGIRHLVDCFYDLMGSTPQFSPIFDMHPDPADSRDRLARFLCGWLGGPKRYQEKYGAISIPAVHRHLDITATERDLWLGCMQQAIAAQPFTEAFKTYLLDELAKPAEAVRRICANETASK